MAIVLVSGLFISSARSQTNLIFRDTIQPVSAAYLHRALIEARTRPTPLSLIMDTPGGLPSSIESIASDLRTSPVILILPDSRPINPALAGIVSASASVQVCPDARPSNIPTTRERLLSDLTNPNLAVFVLLAGIFLIYAEFNVPGTVIPGALGALLSMLALYGLGQLPVRLWAIALCAIGIGLLLSELKLRCRGIPAAAGTLTLIVGIDHLVNGPIAALRVHIITAIVAGTLFSGVTLWLAWVALLARRNKAIRNPADKPGRIAYADAARVTIGDRAE